MFQINPDLYKINCDLQEIHFQLNNIENPDLLEIEQHLSIVADFIESHLQAPSLPYYERNVLLTQKDELTQLAGRCNDQARKMQFAQICDTKLIDLQKERMKEFKQNYNLTIEEQRKIHEANCGDEKVIPLYPDSVVEILDFSDLTDLCYEMAVYLYRKERKKFQNKWSLLSEKDKFQLLRHISLCGGALEEGKELGAMQALIGFAEQNHREVISYPSIDETLEVLNDLSEIYS